MVKFFPNIANELNAEGNAANNINYYSAKTGEHVVAGVYLSKAKQGRDILYLVSITTVAPGTNTAASISNKLVVPPSQQAFAGANIVAQVLADMETYALSRKMAGVGAAPVVNPALAYSLLRKGYTTGEHQLDAQLLEEFSRKDLRNDSQFMAEFRKLQQTKGLTLTKLF